MERNTITTFAALEKGDVFTFAGKDEAWTKTGNSNDNKTCTYNKFAENGRQILKFDERKGSDQQVRFLRHNAVMAQSKKEGVLK